MCTNEGLINYYLVDGKKAREKTQRKQRTTKTFQRKNKLISGDGFCTLQKLMGPYIANDSVWGVGVVVNFQTGNNISSKGALLSVIVVA